MGGSYSGKALEEMMLAGDETLGSQLQRSGRREGRASAEVLRLDSVSVQEQMRVGREEKLKRLELKGELGEARGQR